MKEYKNISEAIEELNKLKSKYGFFQRTQENARYNLKIYDPYDYEEEEVSREEHEKRYATEIECNRFILKNLEQEIKEVKKQIRNLNRKQNERF